MSELPDGIPRAVPVKPRDSSSGVLVREGRDGLECLLGRRSRTSRFMPGFYAFPGGAVENQDRIAEAGGFARTVAREIEEESGLRLAAECWLPAGRRITPPMFPVRFRTEFFVAPAGSWTPPHPLPSTENEAFEFVTPSVALADWYRGAKQLPPPVVPILRGLAELESARPELEQIRACVESVNVQEERAPRIEFVPGTWVLPVSTATLPPATHTNVWMPGDKEFVIVDPAVEDAMQAERLLEVIDRRRQIGEHPVRIFVSHEHQDHVCGVAQMARALSLPLSAARRTLQRIEDIDSLEGVQTEELVDGQLLELAGAGPLVAIATPGHSPAHFSFHLPQQRLLVAGDLVSGISTILIHPDGGDMDDYIASLRRVEALECRVLLPSHGTPIPGKALAKLIAHREERERKVLAAVRSGLGKLTEIARQAYEEAPELPPFLVESQSLAHLLRLEKKRQVERDANSPHDWGVAS